MTDQTNKDTLPKFCHPDCCFLSPNEKNQTDAKEPHVCTLLKETLRHEGHHPHIVMRPLCRKERVIYEFQVQFLEAIYNHRRSGATKEQSYDMIMAMLNLPPRMPQEGVW